MSPFPVRRSGVATIASAAIAAGLLAPSAAHADVTATTVTSPAPETVFDSQTTFFSPIGSEPMTVSGVAPGATDGDQVSLVCTYTLNGVLYVTPVASDPLTITGGAFSTDDARAPGLPCRLRALPRDEFDTEMPGSTDLSAWQGPRLIGGGFAPTEDTVEGSPTFGAESYIAQRGQSKGLVFSFGAGGASFLGGGGFSFLAGGIYTTALLDDTYYRPLFGPSAFLTNFGAFLGGGAGGPFDFSQVGMIVDGKAAMPFAAVGDARAKIVSRTFDPVTADQTVVEDVPIATLIYTGDDVTGIEASGLKLLRTIAQDKEGRRVSVADEFVSVDGAAHRVEARYLQSLYSGLFGGVGDPDSIKEPASFRFPWRTGDAYVSPAAGDEFGPAPAGPATIWVHGARQDFSEIFGGGDDVRAAARAGDAVLPRAEGALVFDSAPSAVKFLATDVFVASFVRDVPAGGTGGVKQTLLQDLTPEGLDGLVDPPVDPPVPPAPPIVTNTPLPTQVPVIPAPKSPFDPLPILAKSTGRILISAAQGRRLRDRKPVTITTKNLPAGRYGVTIRRRVKNGRTLASGLKTIKKDGTLSVRLKLTKYGRHYLALKRIRNRKAVPVRVIVTWTPPGKARERRQTSYLTNFRR